MREIVCKCRLCERSWPVFTEAYAVYECVYCGALMPWQGVRDG
jgi:ribosomal protein S27E